MYMNYRKKCQMSLSNRLKEIIDEIICEDGCMDEEIEEISTSSVVSRSNTNLRLQFGLHGRHCNCNHSRDVFYWPKF